MTRCNVEVILEITTTAPLTHGAGAEGNVQVLARREVAYLDPATGEWRSDALPVVSGQAIRATLREYAATDYLEALGVQSGEISRARMRLLAKGGKLGDSSGVTESVDSVRRMIRLVPMLAVFGCMDDEGRRPGCLCVSDVHAMSVRAVQAGVVPRRIASSDGSVGLVPFGAAPPIPDHLVVTEIQQYRHDLTDSRLGQQYLTPEHQAAADDARAAVQAGASKEERRAASESMPYGFEAIRPGVPMVCTLRLRGASELEVAVVVRALARWIRDGGWLGGGRAAGRGSTAVSVRSVHHDFARTPIDGMEVAPGHEAETAEDAVSRVYMAHVAEVGAEARAYLLPPQSAEPKPKSKRGKAAEASP